MVDTELPIDIPCARLLDWLVQRQLLKAKWRSKCKALQLKVAELKSQLPEDMQNGEPNYQTARLIREALIPSAEKNFLGYYKGEAGIWDKIVRTYEAENVHIGEAAFTLGRDAEFEIPYLRAQLVKHQQQLTDNERRQADYLKSAANAQTQYAQECSSLGIEGKNVTGELRELTKSLPQLLFEATGTLQADKVRDAAQYYHLHVADMAQESESRTSGSDAPLLPTLAAAERAHLEMPAQDPLLLRIERSDEGAAPGGDDDGGISWGDDEAGAQGDDGEIDWDFGMDDSTPQQEEEPPGGHEGDTPSATAGSNNTDGNIVTQLVTDGAFRNTLIVDLCELLAFLQQRITELSSESAPISAAAAESLQQYNLETVQKLSQAVSHCKQAFTDSHLSELLALVSSRHTFDRTAGNLIQKASQEAKFYRLRKELELKMQDLQAKLVEDAGKLKALIAETHELKAFVEEQVAALLKGRKVQITGDFPKSQ